MRTQTDAEQAAEWVAIYDGQPISVLATEIARVASIVEKRGDGMTPLRRFYIDGMVRLLVNATGTTITEESKS